MTRTNPSGRPTRIPFDVQAAKKPLFQAWREECYTFGGGTLALVDGRVVTGLKRREEGTDLVLADQEGKEFRVPLADIDDNKLSSISLMPANFGEQVPQEEFNDLMAWLLNQRPK